MKVIGYLVPIRTDTGEVTGYKNKKVSLATKGKLAKFYGKDKDKQLVVTLKDGDLIELRTLRGHVKYDVSVFDIYHFAIRKYAQIKILEKARLKKENKQILRARRKIEYHDKKLRRKD